MKQAGEPAVALLTWGLVIEDFLDRDGLSLEHFATEFTGSWMFGYASALRRAGVRTVIVCVSGRVRQRQAFHHRPAAPRSSRSRLPGLTACCGEEWSTRTGELPVRPLAL